ncbi:hypothetical protein FRAHR75_20194 [Frankia sp. Hr75.2]|nr:hypothetical protein FRAHR75_20194 [Frankia sp. Hr75.2]
MRGHSSQFTPRQEQREADQAPTKEGSFRLAPLA